MYRATGAYRGAVPTSHLPHPPQPTSPLREGATRRPRRSAGTGLRLALTAALALAGAALGPAGSAHAGECPASGGGAIPAASASGDVVFRGGGWGHGLGMSQYGAQGAARLGCSAEQILTRYYAGTQVASRPMPTSLKVRLLERGYRVDVEAVQGALAWSVDGCVPRRHRHRRSRR